MRLQLPAEKKFVHEIVIPVRWGDMDAMGHVNNTIYFRYFEIARLDWIFKAGVSMDLKGQGPLIVNAWCNFIRQLQFPGDALVRQYVSNPGRSSFDTWLTIERTDEPGVIYAEGGAKTVWTDYEAKKSAPMPDWFRALVS
jgi:acyl-CoA thioester hydrolase